MAGAPVDGGVIEVGELGRGVVAPDRQVAHRARPPRRPRAASWERPRFSSSMVMANHRSGGISGALAAAIRQLVLHGLPTTRMRTSVAALRAMALPCAGEDAAVDGEQVLALHPRLARHGADQQRPVHAGEGLVGARGADHAAEQREGAVLELHRHALEGGQRGLQLEHVQVDGGARAEHLAGGDAEEERVADLTGGAGDGHLHVRIGHRCGVYRSAAMKLRTWVAISSRTRRKTASRSSSVPVAADGSSNDQRSTAFAPGT